MQAHAKANAIRRTRQGQTAGSPPENAEQDDFYSAKTADELVARLLADKRTSG